MRSILAFLALCLVTAGPAAAQAPAARLTVYAAASLKDALDEVDAAYAKAGGGTVAVSYAASSVLARQIEQGAPAGVFISADSDWMDYLAARKLVAPGSRRDLLGNTLALIAPANSTVSLKIGRGMPLARALGAGRIAMAGPDVPAGRYGEAALKSLGVWDSVRSKVVLGENVRAAMRFVSRGEAPLGVVYDTDAKLDPSVKIVGLFPAGSHPRIVYPAAATRRGAGPAAMAYLKFLTGPQAGAVFRRYGFKTLDR
jgi:molybdate transport system substrate-binding protein